MAKDSGYIEMAYSSIPIFANDGTVDMEELNFLMGLALKDDHVDEDEKRVLGNIFDKVKEDSVSPKVWERIGTIRVKYGI